METVEEVNEYLDNQIKKCQVWVDELKGSTQGTESYELKQELECTMRTLKNVKDGINSLTK